jgi:hypothetical protein
MMVLELGVQIRPLHGCREFLMDIPVGLPSSPPPPNLLLHSPFPTSRLPDFPTPTLPLPYFEGTLGSMPRASSQ